VQHDRDHDPRYTDAAIHGFAEHDGLRPSTLPCGIGIQHSLAFLEDDYELNGINAYDIPWTNAPDANNQYMADLTEAANGIVIISAQGRSGNFTRRLEIRVKMGG